MQALKYILVVIDVIVSFLLITIVMIQHKEDQGASSTITGTSANNFLDKNKKWIYELNCKVLLLSNAFSHFIQYKYNLF